MIAMIIKLITQGWKSFPALWAFIVISASASFFCLDISYAYARYQEELLVNDSLHACITIAGVSSEQEAAELIRYSEDLDYTLGSAMYYAREEDVFYVGWYGTDPGNEWFPYTSGNFFSEMDLKGNEKVAYLNDVSMKKINQDHTIDIHGHPYRVIGSGWIVPWNLAAPISFRFPDIISNEMAGSFDCRLIQAQSFFDEGFFPDVTVFRFRHVGRAGLKHIYEEYKNRFPQYDLYLPAHDTDSEVRTIYLQSFFSFSFIPILLSAISFIPVYGLWMNKRRRSVSIYCINGLSSRKAIVLLVTEYVFMLLFGYFIAAVAYRILAGYAADIPSVYHQQGPPLIVSILFVAGLAVLGLLTNMKTIRKVTDTADLEYHIEGRG